MLLAGGGRDTKLRGRPYLIRIKNADYVPQVLDWNVASNKNRVCEGPVVLAGIELRNLRVNCLNIRASKKAGQNISKEVHAGVLDEIAANRAKVVVAVEESLDVDNLRLSLRCQLGLQCVAFGRVHRFERVPIMPNESHHWRRASDVQYETQALSRRPVHVPCSARSSSASLLLLKIITKVHEVRGEISRSLRQLLVISGVIMIVIGKVNRNPWVTQIEIVNAIARIVSYR